MDSLTPKACDWGGGGGSCLITVDSTDAKFPRRRQTLSWQVLLPTTKWAYPENSIFYIPARSRILHSSQDKPIKIMFFTEKPYADPHSIMGTIGWCQGNTSQGKASLGDTGHILAIKPGASGGVESFSSSVDLPTPHKLLARLLVSGSPGLCPGLAEATSCGASPLSFPEP